MRRLFAAAALASLAAAADAQLGGAWVSENGLTTTFFYPGAPNLPLEPGSRSAAEIAKGFADFCLGTGFDKTAIGGAVAKSGWRMDYVPAQMPFKKPAEIGGWRTGDAVLHASDGAEFPKPAQCSLVVDSTAVASREALVDAVTALLGRDPDNLAKKLKKNGKPEKYWRAEWRLTAGPDSGRTVVVGKNDAVKGNHTWQLALYQPRVRKK